MARVLLVHGLWNRAWCLAVMARRLRKHGHLVTVFDYPTRNNGLRGHADDLYTFISKLPMDELHLIGHSMGGLVILNMLSRFSDVPMGRVVLMGTPIRGSRLAGRLNHVSGGNIMLGKVGEDLIHGFRQLPENRPVGMISGVRSVGLGRLMGKSDEPNDGSVTRSETQHDRLTDTIQLAVAHSQMLLSAEVVNQVDQFVMHGNFRHAS